jgi:hypothetical protein
MQSIFQIIISMGKMCASSLNQSICGISFLEYWNQFWLKLPNPIKINEMDSALLVITFQVLFKVVSSLVDVRFWSFANLSKNCLRWQQRVICQIYPNNIMAACSGHRMIKATINQDEQNSPMPHNAIWMLILHKALLI